MHPTCQQPAPLHNPLDHRLRQMPPVRPLLPIRECHLPAQIPAHLRHRHPTLSMNERLSTIPESLLFGGCSQTTMISFCKHIVAIYVCN